MFIRRKNEKITWAVNGNKTQEKTKKLKKEKLNQNRNIMKNKISTGIKKETINGRNRITNRSK